MRMLLQLLASTVVVAGGLAAEAPTAAVQENAAGDWVGTFDVSGRQGVVKVRLEAEGSSGLKGTLELPLEGSGKEGEAGLPLSHVSLEAGRLGFEVQMGATAFVFQGVLEEGVVRGKVNQVDTEGTFELVRIAHVDPVAYDRLTGAYALEPNETLLVSVFGDLGQIGSVEEESGRLRLLYPMSETRFFTGPGLMIPTPIEATITFVTDERGAATGLRVQGNGPARTGRKILFREEQVSFRNGSVSLSGTLILPATSGRHPAVVLTHASGPVSRKSLGFAAYHLARHGVAALAYDKRGVDESQGDWKESSFDDLAADALAAVQLLKERPDINPMQIGLSGGSQGGWIAPLAASRSPDVAFVVVVSAPAVTPAEQGLMMLENELRAAGVPDEEVQEALALERLSNEFTRSGKGWNDLEAFYRKVRDKSWASPPPPKDDQDRRFYRLIMDHDPIPVLERLTCPILVIYGELDVLVPVKPNKEIMEAALRKAGNRDVTVRVFPKGDHNLFLVQTGAMSELPRVKRFVPGHLDAITEWVTKRVTVVR